MKKFCRLLTIICTAALTASVVLPMAWAERGFAGGFGGEWLLIGAALVAGDYLYDRLVGGALHG